MTYLNDIVVDDAMMKFNISYSAAKTLKHINRYVNASRLHGRFDLKGIPYCFASKEKLAERIGKSKRTVARAIAELKAAGLIESRRTRGLAHIYITCLALDGISANGKNGTYINKPYKNYNNSDTSFYLDKTSAETPQVTANAADDAKIAEASARIGAPAAEKTQDAAPAAFKNGFTQPKGKPTPKRPRATKAMKEAAKKRYQMALDDKLDMSNLKWLVPGLDTEYKQLSALIDLIAEAVCVEGRTIRVNGANLTASQYWNMVQHVNSRALYGLFDRLRDADSTIRDKRAYTLAAVYNAVQWDRVTRGANMPKEALMA